jgi:predicted membrane chloride channel (bestrophin family)
MGTISDVFTILFYIFALPFLPIVDLVLSCGRKSENQNPKLKEPVKSDKSEKDKLQRSKYWWDVVIPAIFSVILSIVVFWWSFDVSTFEHIKNGSYKTDVLFVVNFIQGILRFLLPLMLTAAIAKNRTGLSTFRNMCTTLKLLHWHIDALGESKRVNTDVYLTMRLLPFAVKHHLRNDDEIDKLKENKEDKNTPLQYLKQTNGEITDQMLKYLQQNIIVSRNAMAVQKALDSLAMQISSMEHLNSYRIPSIVGVFFYVMMTLFFVCYPISIIDKPSENRLANASILFYVFAGMYHLSIKISDPFQEASVGFQTVKNIASEAKRDLEKIKPPQPSYAPVSMFFPYTDPIRKRHY